VALGKKLSEGQQIFWKGPSEKLDGVEVGLRKNLSEGDELFRWVPVKS
jgi:hypothetical protein